MFDSLISKYVGSAIRAGLQWASAYIVIDPTVVSQFVDSSTAIVCAGATAGITLLWSFLQKYVTSKV